MFSKLLLGGNCTSLLQGRLDYSTGIYQDVTRLFTKVAIFQGCHKVGKVTVPGCHKLVESCKVVTR